MHTHTQAQMHFPFLCLGAATPLQHCTARHTCQEMEGTLRGLLLLRLQFGESRGCKKLSTCMSQGWLGDWYSERNSTEREKIHLLHYFGQLFLNHSQPLHCIERE